MFLKQRRIQEGALVTCPSLVYFFHFHVVFVKILPNNRLASPSLGEILDRHSLIDKMNTFTQVFEIIFQFYICVSNLY